jgi:molybdopterin-guanine dinucleotide biosynthesis protein A
MGREKALLKLAGRPLIAHVVERLRPQVAELFVSANGDPTRFRALGCAVVADAQADSANGPLAGIAAALARAEALGFALLAVAPCDAPFLPRDLVARLGAAMATSGARIAVAESPSGIEPTFSLWRASLAATVAAALAAGEGGPRRLIETFQAARVAFAPEDGVDPFANLNTPEDFAAAQARLA